jgi:hypothetical protein
MPILESHRRSPELLIADLGGRSAVEGRATAQELVEQDPEAVHEAALGHRDPRELFGRRVAGIAPRRLGCRERVGEAEAPDDQHVRPAELRAVALV